jgi:CheY-like chemotaxis protein
MDLEPGLWAVEVDPTQFELAVLNLAVNARDAMVGAGRLRVEACNRVLGPGEDADGLEGPCVRFTVTDTGEGMTPDILERAFEPFFTTKEFGKGSGLGLSQVYGFARQSGGAVRIHSQPGRGTTVTVLLPRANRQPESRDAAPCSGVLPGGGRILLVEDDPIVSAAMTATLEGLGYRLQQAASADEAFGLLRAGLPVDLVLSDVVMPGTLNGVDLAEEVRRLRPDLPVILTTGYAESLPQWKGLRVLAKPYPIERLVEVLESALGRNPARRAG